MMVMVRIISTEFSPVILTPISLFRARILSVTRAIDRPRERASLSTIFTCLPLKKTSVQAKPGRKNTSMKPRAALMMGKLLRKGRASSKTALIGDSQSTPYGSSSVVPDVRAI